VLKPIPTAHLKAADVDDLTRGTRELMLQELIALTESPAGQKATRAEDDSAYTATISAAASEITSGKKDR